MIGGLLIMLYVWCDVFYGYVFYFRFRYINRYKEKKKEIYFYLLE